jgi:hypothetical protein
VDITNGAITITVTGTPTVRTCIASGTKMIVGSSFQVTAISPAPTGTGSTARHGAVIDPGAGGASIRAKNGFDGRFTNANTAAIEYDESLNVGLSLPLTVNAGQSLVCSKSKPDGANEWDKKMLDMSVFHCCASDPGTDAFAPPMYSGSKPIYTRSDVNYSLLPGITAPYDPSSTGIGSFTRITWSDAWRANRVWYDWFASSLGSDYIRPYNNMGPDDGNKSYPGDPQTGTAAQVAQMALYSLCNFADSEAIAERLIKLGIDYYAITQLDPSALFAGAGYGCGRMWPIIFAGIMLNDSDMKNIASLSSGLTDWEGRPIPAFGETQMMYYASNAYSGYLLPKDRSLYTDGVPLYGDRYLSAPSIDGSGRYYADSGSNHTIRDPLQQYDAYVDPGALYWPYQRTDANNILMDNAGSYLPIASRSLPAIVLAAQQLNATAYLPQVMIDYAYRFWNDKAMWVNFGSNFDYDTENVFHEDLALGGTGSGWVREMLTDFMEPIGGAVSGRSTFPPVVKKGRKRTTRRL